jgi:(p)ppGpp synthase/HD superfamily hydrolase
MILGDAFDQALALATDLHREHLRKGTSVPYVSHLMSVAALVLEDGGDEEEAIAALLHDALEDHGDRVTAGELEERFGARVRRLVEACTDTPEDFAGGEKPPWRERKERYLRHITSGETPLRVTMADKVHNARSILRDHREIGERIWDRFSAEKDQTLWYYRELGRAYREAGAQGFLIDEFERTVRELESRAASDGEES